MRFIYRISDAGYNKVKPDYINNENCLKNFVDVFGTEGLTVIADNVSEDTDNIIQKYVPSDQIEYVSIGHGAGTFNIGLDKALKYHDETIIYFIENDYLHRQRSKEIIEEGIGLGASFITLYDHPDKYIDGSRGGNPFVEGGGEVTRVLLSESTHWKLSNSTTMTFASKVKTLKRTEETLRKWTNGEHPNDFKMFLELRDNGESLLSPIPGYSTHGETKWLTPLINWREVANE